MSAPIEPLRREQLVSGRHLRDLAFPAFGLERLGDFVDGVGDEVFDRHERAHGCRVERHQATLVFGGDDFGSGGTGRSRGLDGQCCDLLGTSGGLGELGGATLATARVAGSWSVRGGPRLCNAGPTGSACRG